MLILFVSLFSGCLPAYLSAILPSPSNSWVGTVGFGIESIFASPVISGRLPLTHPLPLQHLPFLVTRYLHNRVSLHQDHSTSYTHGGHTLAWKPGGIILQGQQVHAQPNIVLSCLVMENAYVLRRVVSCPCLGATILCSSVFWGTVLFQFSLPFSVTSNQVLSIQELRKYWIDTCRSDYPFQIKAVSQGHGMRWKIYAFYSTRTWMFASPRIHMLSS